MDVIKKRSVLIYIVFSLAWCPNSIWHRSRLRNRGCFDVRHTKWHIEKALLLVGWSFFAKTIWSNTFCEKSRTYPFLFSTKIGTWPHPEVLEIGGHPNSPIRFVRPCRCIAGKPFGPNRRERYRCFAQIRLRKNQTISRLLFCPGCS